MRWRYPLCIAVMLCGLLLISDDGGWLSHLGGALVGLSVAGAYFTGRHESERAS